jgi:hypothetical protein
MEARIVQTSRSVTGLFDRWADAVKKRTDATYFLEKTPESALRLDYITSHFPESHIVFILRDPRDGLRSAKTFRATGQHYLMQIGWGDTSRPGSAAFEHIFTMLNIRR